MKEQKRHGGRDFGLTLIAIGKLIKVVALTSIGVAALFIAHQDPPEVLIEWANTIGVAPGNRWLHGLVEKVAPVDAKELDAVGVGSFVYASVFAVEGVGLWMQKKWAEYLTVIVTISFIPIEIYEIAHQVSAPKIVALCFNVAVVIYLFVMLTAGRRAREPPGSASR